jgi:hypothetical protein
MLFGYSTDSFGSNEESATDNVDMSCKKKKKLTEFKLGHSQPRDGRRAGESSAGPLSCSHKLGKSDLLDYDVYYGRRSTFLV